MQQPKSTSKKLLRLHYAMYLSSEYGVFSQVLLIPFYNLKYAIPREFISKVSRDFFPFFPEPL